MKKPVHPGRIVRNECLEPLDLSVTEAAKVLGVTRQALNNVVNEKAGISAEMAIRLSKAFGRTPDTWVRMQAAFDLAVALKGAGKSGTRQCLRRKYFNRYQPISSGGGSTEVVCGSF